MNGSNYYGQRSRARTAAVLAFFLLLWSSLSGLGFLSSTFIPGPVAVFEVLKALSPPLHVHFVSTLALVLAGGLLGLVCSWLLTYVILVTPAIERIVMPVFDLLRGVPPICFIPFFILWFGFQPSGKIVLVALNMVLILLPTAIALYRSLSPEHLALWNSTGRTEVSFVLSEALPAITIQLLPTLRFSFSFAVMIAIVAEAMGSVTGLGHLISVSLSTFSLPGVVLVSLAAALMAAIIDVTLCWVVRFLAPWTDLD